MQPGVVDAVLSYCHYSLNDTSLSTLLPYLEQRGVGVINASILSMGLLTPQVCESVESEALHVERRRFDSQHGWL